MYKNNLIYLYINLNQIKKYEYNFIINNYYYL